MKERFSAKLKLKYGVLFSDRTRRGEWPVVLSRLTHFKFRYSRNPSQVLDSSRSLIHPTTHQMRRQRFFLIPCPNKRSNFKIAKKEREYQKL